MRLGLAVVVVSALILTGCGRVGAPRGPSGGGIANSGPYPSCRGPNGQVAYPSGPHGLFVNDANAPQALAAQGVIQKYVLPDRSKIPRQT